jgi:potassium-dependent mechanosensitive channel
MRPEIPEQATEALERLTWKQGVLALGVLLAFLLAAKVAGWLLRRALSQTTNWGGPVFALSKLLTYFLVLIGTVTALSMLGLPLSSLLLTSSALLIGLGFSLQNIAKDFISGVILLVEQPIRRNDYVTFGDCAGTVKEIGLRATLLSTPDGMNLVVPNHLVVTHELSNHSYPLKRARLDVEVPVSLRANVALVEETLSSVARSHEEILEDPSPVVWIRAILDSHFQFAILAWVSEPTSTLRIASELRFAIAHSFAREGIEFPTPELQLLPEPTHH